MLLSQEAKVMPITVCVKNILKQLGKTAAFKMTK